MAAFSFRQRFLVPEVVQTSAMDCGPAVLKAALEGSGIAVSYGRLREACQTDVDGTSIDTLEGIAQQLSLTAEQAMLPVDHLLLPEAEALPALLVVRLPNGATHFVLVWRRHGPLVQVMDPGVGRRWMSCRQLLDEVYVHQQPVPAAAWRAWAVSANFQKPLARRLRRLGLGRHTTPLIEQAAAVPGWQALARLDAATRLVEAVAQGGGVRRGGEACALLKAFVTAEERTIPEPYCSVRPAPAQPGGEEQVRLHGVVLVRIGRPAADPVREASRPSLPSALNAALTEPPSRPARELFRLLRGGGFLSGVVLALGLALVAGGGVLEAVLLRSVLDLGRSLGLVEQRLLAVAGFLAFALVLLALELGLAGRLVRLGRRLEVRLRAAFLDKLPRLHDRYFQSRPISDMAERSHALHQIRLLPRLAGQFLRAALTLALTVVVISWLDPASTVPAAVAAILAVAVPLAFLPLLQGLDLRVRTHAGALSRFYLDALLGLTAVRAHGAERAIRREHESLLVEWVRASQRLLRWVVLLEALQLTAGFGLAGWLLGLHAGRTVEAGGLLLLAYWALNLPVLGEEIALLVRQYPLLRNVTLRLLEPLGAPEEPSRAASPTYSAAGMLRRNVATGGVDLRFAAVTVRAGGHTVLADVDLHMAAGTQVAIVGASGAGKSTLLGLLLGWHHPAAGQIRVDGEALDGARLDQLRRETAWVDPAVQLWNASLLDNLLYGSDPGVVPALGAVLEDAALTDVLQRLPAGLQTPLGEGGGLLSGGQGQRVRFGRALVRSDARLVLLDEPFRGLDREQRRALLRRARQVWRGATLLCVTHDVGETHDFDRVLVIEGSRVVEDDCPAVLAAAPSSRYRALLDAEEAVRTGLWASDCWRRLSLQAGRLVDSIRDTSRKHPWAGTLSRNGANGVLPRRGS
jgi:ATP-binding cassette subfamily B protein